MTIHLRDYDRAYCGAKTSIADTRFLPAVTCKACRDAHARATQPAPQFDGEGGGLNRTRYEANVLDEEPVGDE